MGGLASFILSLGLCATESDSDETERRAGLRKTTQLRLQVLAKFEKQLASLFTNHRVKMTPLATLAARSLALSSSAQWGRHQRTADSSSVPQWGRRRQLSLSSPKKHKTTRQAQHDANETAAAPAAAPDADEDAIVEKDTREWLERVVTGLNLCPFARAALPGTKVLVTTATTMEELR
jgi:hypothetical protein